MKSLTVFLLTVLLMYHATDAQPKLAVDSTSIDLGTIYTGQTKTTRIVLSNIGNQPLKILHVQPSCGCTTVRQPKSELQPNEHDVVEISFNSAFYRGPVEKYVNIETNDPLSQYIAIKLTAQVQGDLTPTSGTYSIYLGNISVGKTSEQSITLTNSSHKTITIKKIDCTSDRVVAKSVQDRVAPNDTLTVVLSARAEKVGYDSETLSIHTDSEHQPTVEFRISYIGQKEGQ